MEKMIEKYEMTLKFLRWCFRIQVMQTPIIRPQEKE